METNTIIEIFIGIIAFVLVYFLLQSINQNKKQKKRRINEGFLDHEEFNEIYLFDFKNFSSQHNNNVFSGRVNLDSLDGSNPLSGSTFIGDIPKENPQKIKIKPIDVLEKLETIPTPFDVLLLDEKISILRDKEKLITQKYAKRELNALIERLENRKKFTEHCAFFDQFQNTTDEKIDTILSKYDLVMKTSDIFVPEFPDDAIKTMKAYTEAMKKVCKKKPIFYVIAEAKDFVKKYERRDPILLVQSPFGFYWQILGAWDKEMLILSEL